MKSSTTLVERAETSYKQKLIAADRLIAKRRAGSHELATLLVSVFNDRDFRADLGNVDDFLAAETLNKYTEGMDGLNFLQVRAVLEHFPTKAAWEGKRLSVLYAEMRAEQRAATQSDKPTREVHRVTREQYDALQDEKKHAEAQLKFQKSQATEALTRVEQLEAEVRRLREENAMLRGRIEQLEKTAGR